MPRADVSGRALARRDSDAHDSASRIALSTRPPTRRWVPDTFLRWDRHKSTANLGTDRPEVVCDTSWPVECRKPTLGHERQRTEKIPDAGSTVGWREITDGSRGITDGSALPEARGAAAVAAQQMGIDHPDGFHESEHGGRADECETGALQAARQGDRLR